MRLHGWCYVCHKVRLVRVSGHGMAKIAMRGTPEGICDQCEQEEIEQRKATYEKRRRS